MVTTLNMMKRKKKKIYMTIPQMSCSGNPPLQRKGLQKQGFPGKVTQQIGRWKTWGSPHPLLTFPTRCRSERDALCL